MSSVHNTQWKKAYSEIPYTRLALQFVENCLKLHTFFYRNLQQDSGMKNGYLGEIRLLDLYIFSFFLGPVITSQNYLSALKSDCSY
jgi:hypothetical protein